MKAKLELSDGSVIVFKAEVAGLTVFDVMEGINSQLAAYYREAETQKEKNTHDREAAFINALPLKVCTICNYRASGKSGFVAFAVPLCRNCNQRFQLAFEKEEVSRWTFLEWIMEQQTTVKRSVAGEHRSNRKGSPRKKKEIVYKNLEDVVILD